MQIDPGTLQKIARIVADPADICAMRAVCREWRAIIMKPVIPHMMLRDAWKWATKYGFDEMARCVNALGARDLQWRVLPRVTIERCAEMWNARFAKSRDECNVDISRAIRAIAHDNIESMTIEDSARITRALIEHQVDEEETLDIFRTIGMFANESIVCGAMSVFSLMCYKDGEDSVLGGAIKMQRHELLAELVGIKCRTARGMSSDLSGGLLIAGEYLAHSIALNACGKIERLPLRALKHAAQSGSRAGCIYARELSPDEFDFG